MVVEDEEKKEDNGEKEEEETQNCMWAANNEMFALHQPYDT